VSDVLTHVSMIWPQILSAVFLTICGAIVTVTVQRTARKLDNIATKDFVADAIGRHEMRMRQMFVDATMQQVTNADVEFRMRRIEAALGVEILRPPIITRQKEEPPPA